MKAPGYPLLVLLTATTLGGAFLAWRQYGELHELRAAAMNRSERADWQRRLWDLEKQNRELQARLTTRRPAGVAGDGSAPDAAESAGPRAGGERPGRGGPRGGPDSGVRQMNAMRELLARPDVQAMVTLQQKAGIESRYAALFKNLNLSTEQAERLGALLIERSTTRQDVFAAAREQGVDPRANPATFRKLLAESQSEIDAGIKSLLGESGFAQLQNFEQTQPQRALVGELQQRLSYTTTPLTSAQAEQLVQILAANLPPRPAPATGGAIGPAEMPPARGPAFGPPPGGGRGPDIPGWALGFGGGPPGAPDLPFVMDSALRVANAPISGAALAQAQTVLTPPQAAALQQIQQQQQAQQQLQQVFREVLAPEPRRGPGTPPPADGARPPATTRPPGGG